MTGTLHQQLWLKAKLFAARAMETEGRPSDERRLWASLGLELLGKAALARYSPVLIATPSEDGKKLLMAAGLLTGDEPLQTLPAKGVFSRCGLAFKPFNVRAAMRIAQDRNEYLHGGGIPSPPIPDDQWWATYWALAEVLIHAQDHSIEDLVGPDLLEDVESKLALNKSLLRNRAEMLISRSRQALYTYQNGSNTAAVQKEWERSTPQPLDLSHHTQWVCPACGADGVLEGDEVRDVRREWEQVDDIDFEHYIWLEVYTDSFTCRNCHLRVRDAALAEEMGLPATFDVEGTVDDLDLDVEYGND